MGEYVKYKGAEVKIGTCESLYYTSWRKFKAALDSGLLSQAPNKDEPAEYARPDSGFRLRFPFADEDNLALGDIGDNDYRRGLTVLVSPAIDDFIAENFKERQGELVKVDITQQKLVHREADGKLILAAVLRDPATGQSYSVMDDAFINRLGLEVLHNMCGESQTYEKRYCSSRLQHV